MQLTHYNSKFKLRKFPIVLVCDHVSNATNIGSLFRISDAFGIEKIIFCNKGNPVGRKIKKTSRATEKVVNYEVQESVIDVILNLKKNNYQIISLEITAQSQAIHNYTFSIEKPIALVVGDENFGVSEAVLNESDTIIHIEMFGHNSSMNVVQATNIMLYEITKQLL